MPDARCLRGCDGPGLVFAPVGSDGADQQHPVDTGQGGGEVVRVEVHHAQFRAPGSQVGQRGGVAGAGNDACGTAGKQFLDGDAAEVPTGTGDQKGLVAEVGHDDPVPPLLLSVGRELDLQPRMLPSAVPAAMKAGRCSERRRAVSALHSRGA